MPQKEGSRADGGASRKGTKDLAGGGGGGGRTAFYRELQSREGTVPRLGEVLGYTKGAGKSNGGSLRIIERAEARNAPDFEEVDISNEE